jgi:hypothetical protein
MNRGSRLIVTLLLVAVSGCGRERDVAPLETGDGRGSPAPTVGATAGAAPTGGPATGTDAGTVGPGPADADGSPIDPPPSGAVGPNDDGPLGANAFAYLNGSIPKLVVEVDAVRGAAPASGTLDLLRARLASVAGKPGGIVFRATQTIPGDDNWSTDDLRKAEARYRDTHSSNSSASLYLLFVDGQPPKEGALGIAYSASAAALFADQIDEAATVLVTAEAIERGATVHEVGHLLSLVNLGYTSPRDHEDPNHKGHSDNAGSVMYWAIDNVGVVGLLGGSSDPPTAFDPDDRADLADVQTGKLRPQNS